MKESAELLRDYFAVDQPLQVSLMRGGMYHDNGWTANPVQLQGKSIVTHSVGAMPIINRVLKRTPPPLHFSETRPMRKCRRHTLRDPERVHDDVFTTELARSTAKYLTYYATQNPTTTLDLTPFGNSRKLIFRCAESEDYLIG